jgi:MoxR-like ATPase
MKLKCRICGKKTHDLGKHVEEYHGLSGPDYCKQEKHYVNKDGRLISDWLVRQREMGIANHAEPKTVEVKPPEPKIEPDLFLPDKRQEAELLSCIESGDNCLLTGPTGCGKTSLVEYIAKKRNVELVITKFYTDMVPSDILGHYIFTKDKSMEFSYGVLPKTMDPAQCNDGNPKEYWLLIDEMDAAPARVLFPMFGLLEDHRSIYIMETGETVKATPKFRVIASANTKGMDEEGRYVRQIFDEAFYDRWSVFECDFTPHETQLLVRRCGIENGQAVKMMDFVDHIRRAIKNDELRMNISTRRLLDWGKKIKRIGFAKATKLSLINRLSVDDAQVYKDLVQRIFDLRLDN